MPEMSGVELCREIRAIATTPIIVLSVREQEGAKVSALDAGADDYVTKPFNIQELKARVRAQLRRQDATKPALSDSVHVGDFTIDVDQHRVNVRGTDIHLTPKQFELLLYMAHHPDRVLSHRDLLNAVWGANATTQPEYLRVSPSAISARNSASSANSTSRPSPGSATASSPSPNPPKTPRTPADRLTLQAAVRRCISPSPSPLPLPLWLSSPKGDLASVVAVALVVAVAFASLPLPEGDLLFPTHYKRAPFGASCGALARIPSAAVAVKDLRPLRGAHRTRVLDSHPRCGCLLVRRSIYASPFSKRTGERRKEHSDG